MRLFIFHTIETCYDYSYNFGGLEEPQSDLFTYSNDDILNTLDSSY